MGCESGQTPPSEIPRGTGGTRMATRCARRAGLALAAATILAGSCPAAGPTVTLGTLLAEMVDRDAAARLPEPAFTLGQASSYDRESTAPGRPGRFANAHRSRFLRREAAGFCVEGPIAVGPGTRAVAARGAPFEPTTADAILIASTYARSPDPGRDDHAGRRRVHWGGAGSGMRFDAGPPLIRRGDESGPPSSPCMPARSARTQPSSSAVGHPSSEPVDVRSCSHTRRPSTGRRSTTRQVESRGGCAFKADRHRRPCRWTSLSSSSDPYQPGPCGRLRRADPRFGSPASGVRRIDC